MTRRAGRAAARRRPRGKRAAQAPARATQPPAPARGAGRREALLALGLGLAIAASYFPAFLAGFVWDDEAFTDAAAVRDPSGIWRIWFAPRSIENEGHYWPIVYTTFWLEHKLWGLAPAGYHTVNVALHFANTLLLWRLGERLAIPGAWWLAVVFAVHPLHVESVAWVIERKDVLSALFYLAALLAWVRFTDEARPDRRARHYAWALALFALGLLCKSIVVTLPAALLIVAWWRHGRVEGRDWLRLAPFFALGLAVAIADTSFAASREPLSLGYSVFERTQIAARALWFYAGKLLWPADLAVIYPHWPVGAADLPAWGWVVAAAALAAALWTLRGRIGRGPLAGALFFAVTLAPVLGFVDYGYMQFSFVADRYQYLAGIGLLAVFAGAAARGAARLPPAWRKGAAGLAAAMLLVPGALTWRQAGIYRDEVAFFTHIVSYNPEARGAQDNLGNALLRAGRPADSLAPFHIALEQEPDSVKTHANLGAALIRLGRLDEAQDRLRRALALDPRHPIALQNMGESLRKQGRFEAAIDHYRAVIEVDPDNAFPHAGMGDSLFRLGRHDEALRSLDRALALEPALEAARNIRDSVLASSSGGGEP